MDHEMLTWLVVEPTPVKNMKVNWDDEIPQLYGKTIEKHGPNHQLVTFEDHLATTRSQVSGQIRSQMSSFGDC